MTHVKYVKLTLLKFLSMNKHSLVAITSSFGFTSTFSILTAWPTEQISNFGVGAKRFILKLVFLARSLSCKSNSFLHKRLWSSTRFETEAGKSMYLGQFSTCTYPIIHLFYPAKFCIIIVCNFSWDMKMFQGKSKTMPM